MRQFRPNMKATLLLSSMVVVLVVTVGCPPTDNGEAKLTTVFTGDGTALANKILNVMKAEVPVEDIESLTVTITRIVMDKDDEMDDDNGEVEEESEEKVAEKEDDNPAKIEVFSGEMRVNILDLTGVSQLISLEEVPAGHYTKIRLEIEDPELVLKAEPETVYTNIQLTANDRLFIDVDFDLEDGENRILVLDFGGIHLVELGPGNGGYVLTPQLRASLEIRSFENTFVQGVIESIDYDTNTLVLLVEGGEITVTYSEEAEIFLASDDETTPTGEETDLLPEMEVICYGDLYSDNTMTATRIEIVPEETEE
ncbi:MAG: DUF4382 domain-containing protein [Candidatus Hydrogenedentota bacterium]